ncbi:hypothetical protein EVAR_70550_1 [Eumeta japonica]|uniref:Uncharacterized protein n=1 Tax=Eumeta variegata TaxID=151549 RepID=A0A4C2A937_EUMVA|nr:hypothetical protein EVAR_70550_1 [Eumeta japonica]
MQQMLPHLKFFFTHSHKSLTTNGAATATSNATASSSSSSSVSSTSSVNNPALPGRAISGRSMMAGDLLNVVLPSNYTLSTSAPSSSTSTLRRYRDRNSTAEQSPRNDRPASTEDTKSATA